MGIRTEISTNPAMTLGGLEQGVTPLEMAYAYSTIANKGIRISGSLAASKGGPVAIEKVSGGDRKEKNKKTTERVFSEETGETAQELLAGVVLGGTGKSAQIGEFAAGKTGTTENYGDAWFVGFNSELTVAVWVGYPEGVKPMQTEYAGGPVAGGTYPAEIWGDLMRTWIGIRDRREAEREAEDGDDDAEEVVPVAPTEPVAPAVPEEPVDPGAAEPDPSEGRGAGARTGRPGARADSRPGAPARADSRAGAGAGPRADPRRRRGRRRRARVGTYRLALRIAGGRGGDTQRLVASQKRHGSSTALVIPIRVPTTSSGGRSCGGRARISIGSPSVVRLSSSPMPSAWVSFPGPEHRSSGRSRPRRSRIASRPSTGSRARISTAAPTPSSSHTALSRAWTP